MKISKVKQLQLSLVLANLRRGDAGCGEGAIKKHEADLKHKTDSTSDKKLKRKKQRKEKKRQKKSIWVASVPHGEGYVEFLNGWGISQVRGAFFSASGFTHELKQHALSQSIGEVDRGSKVGRTLGATFVPVTLFSCYHLMSSALGQVVRKSHVRRCLFADGRGSTYLHAHAHRGQSSYTSCVLSPRMRVPGSLSRKRKPSTLRWSGPSS